MLLHLIKHHAMKTCRNGRITPFILTWEVYLDGDKWSTSLTAAKNFCPYRELNPCCPARSTRYTDRYSGSMYSITSPTARGTKQTYLLSVAFPTYHGMEQKNSLSCSRHRRETNCNVSCTRVEIGLLKLIFHKKT
jgi:hypothetical protein